MSDNEIIRVRRWYAGKEPVPNGIAPENIPWRLWQKVGDGEFDFYDRRDIDDLIALLKQVRERIPEES